MIADKINNFIFQKATTLSRPIGFNVNEAGYLCPRYHFHAMVDWNLRPIPNQECVGSFSLGIALEDYAMRLLAEVGVPFDKSWISTHDKHMDLVVQVDGFVNVGKKKLPIKLKSVSQEVLESIHNWHDMVHSNWPWMRSLAMQLPLYMRLHDIKDGIYLFINKQTGMFKEVLVKLDDAMPLLEKVDGVLSQARMAIEKRVPPPEAPEDPIFCVRCWVRSVGLCPGIQYDSLSEPDIATTNEVTASIAGCHENAEEHEYL